MARSPTGTECAHWLVHKGFAGEAVPDDFSRLARHFLSQSGNKNRRAKPP